MSLFNFFRGKRHKKERFILCLDGGGMRGIIPVLVLQSFEKHLRENGAENSIASYFDMVAGTSTGGLIALALTCPTTLDSVSCKDGKQVSLKVLEKEYMTIGKEVFPPSASDFFGIGKAARQLAFDRYPYAGIENLLKTWFCETKLAQASVPTLIMSYDLTDGREAMLRSYKDNTIFAWEAGRATSAAPTYYAPYSRLGHLLADGGVIANNPSLYAFVEAKKMFPDCDCFHILSIGTSNDIHTTSENEISGLLNWIDQVSPMFSTAQRRTVDYIMEDAGLADYLRINDTPDRHIKMDDWSPETMQYLHLCGEKTAAKYDRQIALFAKTLAERKR